MNNFERLKPLFKKETGQDWNTNIANYIAYYQAKLVEDLVQGYYLHNKIVKK